MADTNTVTISGSMVQKASGSETQDSVPKASFTVLSRRVYYVEGAERIEENEIEVLAYGHGANAILKYGGPGVAVLVTGYLSTYVRPIGRMHVVGVEVGFPSVSQCRGRDRE